MKRGGSLARRPGSKAAETEVWLLHQDDAEMAPEDEMKEFHPFTEQVPTMADSMELSMQIAHEGQREPIILYEKKILEGRMRYRACLELGLTPIFRDWVMLGEKDPIDWMLRKHIEQHEPTREARIVLAAKFLNYYRENVKGSTREKLADAVGLGGSTVQMVTALHDRGLLDPVLRGEISLRQAAKNAGVSHGGSYTNDYALGVSFGKGDKFHEATLPMRRYLKGWKARGYRFAHLNPKEAAKRVKVIEEIEQELANAKADLEPRAVMPKVTASPEKKKRRS